MMMISVLTIALKAVLTGNEICRTTDIIPIVMLTFGLRRFVTKLCHHA